MIFGIVNMWTDGKFEHEVFDKITSRGGKLLEQGTIDYGAFGKASYVEYEVPRSLYIEFLCLNGDFEPLDKESVPIGLGHKKCPILSKVEYWDE